MVHCVIFKSPHFPSPCLPTRRALERRPVRIAVEKNASIGSLVDPRHFSDRNSTHTVVGTECTACLTARCAAPTRASLPSGTVQLIRARA